MTKDEMLAALQKEVEGYNKIIATENGDWIVKGFIDIYKNIYTITIDTKVVSKVLEILLIPAFETFAQKNDLILELPPQQNFYPDLTFISKQSGERFAVDIKSTFKDKGNKIKSMTLGAFTGYFRNRESTKNTLYPYGSYSAHLVLGVVYSQIEVNPNEKTIYSLDELDKIVSVIRDFKFFVQPKYKIASATPGSGNTKNIGSINNLTKLLNGQGVFSTLGEEVYDDYWMFYLTKDMAKALEITRPYTNLKSYLEYKQRGINILEEHKDEIEQLNEEEEVKMEGKKMNKKIIVPPIKSQGIKTKLVPWIMELAPKVNGKWIEPFLGTGVVAFNSGYKQAILNDTNPHIIHFYKGIQQKTITAPLMKQYLEQEGELLSKADNNGYEHYLKVRTRFNTEFSPFDFIFLSRAGFNGMMRFGKKGNWNIPFCKKPDRFAQAYITKIVNQLSNISKIIKPEPDWTFFNTSFAEIIPLANDEDIIYCDPPYYGRYVDYFNGWTEQDEELLFNLLRETKSKFILSTWHHNDWRENEMINKFWNKFNIVTKDHFYHSGGNIENRKTVVEALVCNFNLDNIQEHNHGQKERPQTEQLSLQLA